jgi:Ohr subfamily peroxiredoxin
MPDKVLYTAEATSTGDGRSGHVVSSDHRLDFDLARPTEMGGDGNGTNPEQLFAAGYSACFHSALRVVARRAKVDPGDSTVTAQVGIGPDGDAFKVEEVFGSDALLLGRRTYEGFAAAWPERTDEVGFADRMNSMAKYVVSGTLEQADWNNTTVIGGDLADGVRDLKSRQGGDILVAGSGRLVAGLVEHDLVDEYRLMVFPTILGRGRRLFPESDATADLELVEARPSADVTLMILRPKRS